MKTPSSLTLPNSARTPHAFPGFNCPPRSNDNSPQPSRRIRGDSEPLLAYRAMIIFSSTSLPCLTKYLLCIPHVLDRLLPCPLIVNMKNSRCVTVIHNGSALDQYEYKYIRTRPTYSKFQHQHVIVLIFQPFLSLLIVWAHLHQKQQQQERTTPQEQMSQNKGI